MPGSEFSCEKGAQTDQNDVNHTGRYALGNRHSDRTVVLENAPHAEVDQRHA